MPSQLLLSHAPCFRSNLILNTESLKTPLLPTDAARTQRTARHTQVVPCEASETGNDFSFFFFFLIKLRASFSLFQLEAASTRVAFRLFKTAAAATSFPSCSDSVEIFRTD